MSYETFRLHAERFTAPGTCDLLICDEAHRLKVGARLVQLSVSSTRRKTCRELCK